MRPDDAPDLPRPLWGPATRLGAHQLPHPTPVGLPLADPSSATERSAPPPEPTRQMPSPQLPDPEVPSRNAGAISTGTSTAASPASAVPRGGSVRPPRRSPMRAVVSWVGRSGGLAAAGTITGPMTCDQITATGRGRRLLALAAGAIASVALAALLVVGGMQVITPMLVPHLPVLLMVALLLVVLRLVVFGFRRRSASVRLVAGAAKWLTGIVAAPMRAGSSRGHEQSTEVRRFRVTEVSGRQVDCELVGELPGAQPRHGDVVDVFGRRTRRGTVRVRAVVLSSDQTRITARPGLRFVLARLTNAAVVALSTVCVISAAYLLLTR
jgi:hypothetical protein